MNRREVDKIQSYLDERESDSSSFMCDDDSDDDPDYGPRQPGPSHSRSFPPVRCYIKCNQN